MNNERFILVLHNDRIPSYLTIGYIFTFINIAAFVMFLFLQSFFWAGIGGLVATLLYFIIRRIMVKRKLHLYLIDETIFFLFAAVWLWKSLIIALLMVLVGILFKVSLAAFRFVFTKNGVEKDFFPKKIFPWSDFHQVILKDGLLTLDFKNDRLMQGTVENMHSIDQDEFNLFATEQLRNSSK